MHWLSALQENDFQLALHWLQQVTTASAKAKKLQHIWCTRCNCGSGFHETQ
jgi:hypothetical protein